MSIDAYQGIAAGVSSITPLRGAAGIYIPNHNFRDWNQALYLNPSYDGPDGNTWRNFGFRDWYTRLAGDGYNHSYGELGKMAATGQYDPFSLTLSATTATAGEDIEGTNQVLHSTLMTDHLPFDRLFASHYLKPLTAAFTLYFNTLGFDAKWGTEIKCYVAHYNTAHEFCSEANGDWNSGTEPYATNPIELEFTLDGDSISSGTWYNVLAHSTFEDALCAASKYVQLYLGVQGDDSNEVRINLSQASLMMNPANTDAVTDADPDYFVDLANVYLESPPGMSYGQLATRDLRMADGRLERINPLKGGPVEQAQLSWYSEDGDTKQKLLALWNMSHQGLGVGVPNPVPLCLDVGMGQLPWLAYYHLVGDLNAPFNPFWTTGSQGYDMGCKIVGVG